MGVHGLVGLMGGGRLLFFPPLYRPRVDIVRRTASFIVVFFKVNDSSQQKLLQLCCFFDHVAPNRKIKSYYYCCVSFVSLFNNLRPPRDCTSHTSRRGTLYIYSEVCFFGPSACFSLPAAGLSSCSRFCGTQGARLDPLRKVGPWPRSVTRALGIQSGASARGGTSSTLSRPGPCKLVKKSVKKMSAVSCDIWDLECYQGRETLHSW